MDKGIRELAEQAWDASESTAEVAAAVEVPADNAAPVVEDTPAAATDKPTDSGRDEKGRFKAKEGEQAPAAPADPAQVSGQPAEQGKEAASPSPIKPPVSWPAEKKALFAQLPPDVQRFIVDREGEREKFLHQKSEEAERTKGVYRDVEQALQPRLEAWAREGTSAGQAVNQLLAISDFAAKDPKQFINWFAQQRGIDLKTLETTTEQEPPAVAALRRQVDQLQGQLGQRQQQEQTQVSSQVQSQVAEFENARDEHGNPKHPYFLQVKPRMAALIQSGQANTLDEAYETACWTHPEIRKSMLEDQEADRRAAAEKEAREKAANAARASSSLRTGGASGTTAPARGMSTRQIAESAWDAVMK